MKIESVALMPVIRLGAAVAKQPGGHDSVVFQGGAVILRSYPIAIDVEVPGIDLSAVVSAKSLYNSVKNMDTGQLEFRTTKTQLIITDGVRTARLKLHESGDPIPLIELPEVMDSVPAEFNLALSRVVADGGGNDGIQFLENMAVSKGKSELIISEIPKMPEFYLQKMQIELLKSAAISDLSVFTVSDNMVYFNDPGHCTIRCTSAVIPGAVTKVNMDMFKTTILEPAVEVFAGVMDETVGTVLKRVLTFGANDERMGIAVRIIFDPETHTVRLLGENVDGAFEEATGMEYDFETPLDILISSASLQELVGRPFVIKQRPDEETGIWFVAVEGTTLYVCAGTKA